MTESADQQPNALNLNNLNQEMFGALIEPHRRALKAHCYRMMGSIQDAEDMVQETFLRAWRRRETFEARASLRAWLYKIATNICLDALRKRPRRAVPLTHRAESTLAEPIPESITEPIWLEPYPDEWLIAEDENPEGHVLAQEHINLAFIAALHVLPPRQRAILILREVLDWQSNEVADLLDITVPAVKSALHRARTTLANYDQLSLISQRSESVSSEAIRTQLEDYVRAWENADIDGLLKLLKEDATFSMPPIPSWYRGRATIGALTAKTIFSGQAQGRWRLLPTNANHQIAFGLYRQGINGTYDAYGIQVLTIDGSLIADILTFRNPALLKYFNLPMTLNAY
ncbi:MAG: sigma-70 family RNA polymerase sigma factor [Chloroflexota bacterium]